MATKNSKEMKTTNMDVLLRCPICKQYFNNPVMISECSHNYCSECIRRSLLHKQECPQCRTKIIRSHLHPNNLIRQLVQSYQLTNKDKMDHIDGKMSNNNKIKSKSQKNGKYRSRSIQCNLLSINNGQSNHNNNKSKTRLFSTNSNKNNRSNQASLTSTTSKSKSKKNNIQSFMAPFTKKKKNSKKRKADVLDLESDTFEPPKNRRKLRNGNNANSTSKPVGNKVNCPICHKMIVKSFINSHIDKCLSISPVDTNANTIQSDDDNHNRNIPIPQNGNSNKNGCNNNKPVEIEVNMDDDDDIDIIHNDETKDKQEEDEEQIDELADDIRASSMDIDEKDEGEIQCVEIRTRDKCPIKPMPYSAYEHMNIKDIKKMLDKLRLNKNGDKKILIKRHREFVLRHNSQIDAWLNYNDTMDDRDIARAINNEESRQIHSNFFSKSNNKRKKNTDKSKQEERFKKLIKGLNERMGIEYCRKRRKYRKKRRRLRRQQMTENTDNKPNDSENI